MSALWTGTPTTMTEDAVLLIDDATLASPQVLAVVNPAMDGRRQVIVKSPRNIGVLDEAAVPLPFDLRSLDAIHLATARKLGQDLGAITSYDERIVQAAAGAKTLGGRVLVGDG